MKLKWKNIIIFIFGIICFISFSVSLSNIIKWKIDSDNITKEVDEIHNSTDVIEVEDSLDKENITIIENEEEIPKFDPYFDYIKMNLIDVDFNELKNINSSLVGWIQVKGTNINYPFVQTSNNDYYLNHTFNKNYNMAGWIFLDYRNNILEIDKNNIIYGHGRLDNTMFGSLRNIISNGWLNDTNNFIIKLSTEKHNTLWQVFSVYKIPTTNDYLQIEFESDDEFMNFSNKLLNRSEYNFNTSISASDKILTLSTCYNDKDIRTVLHAKLIKFANK